MSLILHQSGIKRLSDCDLQFWLEEIRRTTGKKYLPLYLLQGTAMHRTAQLLHTDVSLMLESEDIVPILIDNFMTEELEYEASLGNEYMWDNGEKKDRQKIIEDFTPAFKNYCKAPWNDPKTYTLLYNETSFRLKFGPAIFEGQIDQLRQYNELAAPELRGKLVEIDLKSGAQAPNQTFLDRDYQHSMYNLACMLSDEVWQEDKRKNDNGEWIVEKKKIKPVKRKPDESWWYHLRNHIPYKRASTKAGVRYRPGDERGDPRHVTHRSEKELEYWKKYFCDIHARLRMSTKQGFKPRPSLMDCATCKAKELCLGIIRGDTEGAREIQDLFKEAGLNTEEQLNV